MSVPAKNTISDLKKKFEQPAVKPTVSINKTPSKWGVKTKKDVAPVIHAVAAKVQPVTAPTTATTASVVDRKKAFENQTQKRQIDANETDNQARIRGESDASLAANAVGIVTSRLLELQRNGHKPTQHLVHLHQNAVAPAPIRFIPMPNINDDVKVDYAALEAEGRELAEQLEALARNGVNI